MKALGIALIAVGALTWFAAAQYGVAVFDAQQSALDSRHTALVAASTMRTQRIEPTAVAHAAVAHEAVPREAVAHAAGGHEAVPPSEAQTQRTVQTPAETDSTRRVRLPLINGRISFETDALALIESFVTPVVPVQGAAPTQSVGVRMTIEPTDAPSELAAQRFNALLRVLRRRGVWRAQVRNLGWESGSSAALELTLVAPPSAGGDPHP